MIDLHMHTTHSDGTWSTKRILEEAEKTGLDYISITDHNSVEAYYDIENEKIYDIFKGKIITGCEFGCYFNNSRIELLGYNIDVRKTKKWIKENYHYEDYSFQDEFDKLVDLCNENNIRLTDNLTYDNKKKYPYDIIYEDITKYSENKKFFTDDEWNSLNSFYRSASCNKDNPLHIDFNIDPSAKDLSDFIRSVGGKVFIAHTFVYKFDNTLEVLEALVNNNIIDGIEVYHTEHTEKEINILLSICKERGLLISAGSDCHGDKKKERKMGKIYKGEFIENSVIDELLKSIKMK